MRARAGGGGAALTEVYRRGGCAQSGPSPRVPALWPTCGYVAGSCRHWIQAPYLYPILVAVQWGKL